MASRVAWLDANRARASERERDCGWLRAPPEKIGPPTSRAGARRLYFGAMRILDRLAKVGALLGAFGIASLLAIQLHGGGLWEGLAPAIAAGNPAVVDQKPAPYDLTQLKVVNEVLKTIRDRYVDPKRVKPKEMLLSALDYVQKDVAQVIVTREENNPAKVKVRVDTQEKEFRVDDVVGPWDVSSHLRDVVRLHAGRPARDGRRPARRRVRGVQRDAAHARPALGPALARTRTRR